MVSSMVDNDYFAGAGTKSAEVTGSANGVKEFTLCTRRINSFHARGCAAVFASLALISLVIAVVFAALGAWLILPFAGLEACALYLVYDWITRHVDDAERLEIRGNAVMLAVTEQTRTQHYEFNRAWAQLVVDRRNRDLRLALRSHGRQVEVGRYLDDGGRQRLARELKARLYA